jgi:uncharacterized protein YjiS (DUF1127 family)
MSKPSVNESGTSGGRRATDPAEWPPTLFKGIRALRIWRARRRQRQALAALNDHLLNDIGLTHEMARREAAKSFWRR